MFDFSNVEEIFYELGFLLKESKPQEGYFKFRYDDSLQNTALDVSLNAFEASIETSIFVNNTLLETVYSEGFQKINLLKEKEEKFFIAHTNIVGAVSSDTQRKMELTIKTSPNLLIDWSSLEV